MASPNISFDSIPSSIRKPGKYFEFNTKLAVRTLPGNLQKVLIVGQRLAAGTVAVGVATDVFSDKDAAAYFGRGSMLHRMCTAAIKAYPYLALTAIAVDDGAGSAAATGTFTLTGTATASGLLTVKIGDLAIELAVATGDSNAAVATALNAAIAKYPDLAVTAAVALGVVTLTARNRGTQGNELKVSATSAAAGLTVAAVAFAGGLVDPDITATLAAVFAAGHHIIVTPYNVQASLTILRTHLDSVSGPMEQRGAIGVYASTASLSSATTLAGLINSGRIASALVPGSLTPGYEIAAAFAAVVASEEDPARPLNTLQLTGVNAPPLASRLSRTEQENALYNGVTPFEVGPGDKVQIVRAITTYTKDAQGIDDVSLLDLTTIRTLDYVRVAVRTRIALRFPREKLSEKTPPKVRSEILDVLTKLEELEIVEAVEANKPGLIVERDSQDVNRLNAKIPTDVVNGLHVFAGRIDLLL